jgi:hemolysin activation/secretion protein
VAARRLGRGRPDFAPAGLAANAFAELRRGLGIFDATDGDECSSVPPSRIDGDATATVLRAGGQGELALGRDFAIAVSPRLQYAFDALLSFEEFTAGNYTVGRGYDPATLSGDSGVGVTAELRGPR